MPATLFMLGPMCMLTVLRTVGRHDTPAATQYFGRLATHSQAYFFTMGTLLYHTIWTPICYGHASLARALEANPGHAMKRNMDNTIGLPYLTVDGACLLVTDNTCRGYEFFIGILHQCHVTTN